MPRSASRICAEAGCGARCAGIYCEAHGGALKQTRGMRQNSNARGYGWRHQQWRKLILHRDPLCKIGHFCKGYAPSVIADHVVPLRAGGDWSLENGQGACKPCHDWKTRTIDTPRIHSYQAGQLTPMLHSEHPECAGKEKGKAETASRDKHVSGAADSGERVGGTRQFRAAPSGGL